MSQEIPGLKTVRRTLRMAAWFEERLMSGEPTNSTDIMNEFGLSRKTAQRFVRLFKEEFDSQLYFSSFDNSYKTERVDESEPDPANIPTHGMGI